MMLKKLFMDEGTVTMLAWNSWEFMFITATNTIYTNNYSYFTNRVLSAYVFTF